MLTTEELYLVDYFRIGFIENDVIMLVTFITSHFATSRIFNTNIIQCIVQELRIFLVGANSKFLIYEFSCSILSQFQRSVATFFQRSVYA